MRTSTWIFVTAISLQVISSLICAFLPLHLQRADAHPDSPRTVFEDYTLADSNLDVCSASLIYALIIAILVLRACNTSSLQQGSQFRDDVSLDTSTKISAWIYWVSLVFQLLLLSKAVAVAILASSDDLFPTPKRPGVSGLAFIFGALGTSVVCSLVESPAARSMIKSWKLEAEEKQNYGQQRQIINGEGNGVDVLTQPLLTSSSSSSLATKRKDPKTIRSLMKLSAPDSPILLLAFSAGAIAALGQALIPYFTGKIIDYASIEPDKTKFQSTTLKLLGVALVCAIFTGIRGGLFTISMTRLNVRLRQRLFASLLNQDPGFFDTTKTGDITSRLAADTTTVSDQISLNLNVMLRSLTQATMVLAFMISASWRLTVIAFVLVPIVIAISKVYGAYYRKMSKKVQSELAEANSVAEEALSTMTTVKSHAAEGSTKAAYAHKLDRFYSLLKREAAAYAAYMTINTFLSAAVVALLLYYGGTLVFEDVMSAGSLIAFMLYQQSLSSAFQALGDVFSALSAAVGAADKVVELMHQRPCIPPAGKLASPMFSGHLELRNVTFAYPARPHVTVLSNFNLSIQPGEVVALVGASGGGKSSIVKLLQRFYLPISGSVLIDGRDVGSYDPGWLRRHIAMVSQEPVLYARSIKRNIVYGLEKEDGVPEDEIPTDANIEEAAKLANAHDFITALPQGYDTECGERGVQLSGGQKQRLAIARALVRRPAVLLLDEATSALDADSEAVVQEALDNTMAGRTVLVIAHRLSTIQNASRIVVIQSGSVVEMGTHDELVALGGVYASLVRRQLTKSPSVASSMHASESRGDLIM